MAVNSCRLGLKAYEEVYTTGCLLRAISLPVENRSMESFLPSCLATESPPKYQESLHPDLSKAIS
jgi:hypothetical protein